MISSEKLGELYVEVVARATKLEAQLQAMRDRAQKASQGIEAAFQNARVNINTNLFNKSIRDIEVMRDRLQAKLKQKIEMNADLKSVQRTRSALQTVEAQLGGISSQGTQTTSTLVSGFGKVFATLGGIYLFKRIGEFLFDISLQAAKVEEATSFFKGSSVDLENFRQAVKGTVTDANLIQLSNQANDLGITLRDQPLLFALAKRAAEAYGTSTEEGFGKVVMATEGNVRALRAIGIQKAIYNEFVKSGAKEHGGLITEMDSETQKQIRLDAIIRASGLTMDDVNKSIKSHADQIEGAGVKWENFLNKLGTRLAPMSAKIAEFFSNAIDPETFSNIQNRIGDIKTLLQGDEGWGLFSKERIASLITELNDLEERAAKLTGKGLVMSLPLDYATPKPVKDEGLSEDAILKRAQDLANAQIKYDSAVAESKAILMRNEYEQKKTRIENEYSAEVKSIEERGKAERLQRKVTDLELGTALQNRNNKLAQADKDYAEASRREEINVRDLRTRARIAGIVNIYDRERASIKEQAEKELNQYSMTNGEKLGMVQQFADARQAIEDKLSTDLQNLQRQRDQEIFDERIRSIGDLGDVLARAFDKTGESWIAKLNEALQIALRIADAISKSSSGQGDETSNTINVIKSIAQIASLFAEHGGVFVGARKLAGGGSFDVPMTGMSGDSYPLLVKARERVEVTPVSRVPMVEQAIGGMMNRMDVMTANIIDLFRRRDGQSSSMQLEAEIRNDSIYLSNKKGERRYARSR